MSDDPDPTELAYKNIRLAILSLATMNVMRTKLMAGLADRSTDPSSLLVAFGYGPDDRPSSAASSIVSIATSANMMIDWKPREDDDDDYDDDDEEEEEEEEDDENENDDDDEEEDKDEEE